MIVVDASAVTELLLQTELGRRVEARFYSDDDDLHVPHLLDVEVLTALRRLVHAGEVDRERAEEALDDLASLRLIRHGQLDLTTRAWELRANLTAYDAVYVTLAESLDATVVTCDGPLGMRPDISPGSRLSGRTPTSDAAIASGGFAPGRGRELGFLAARGCNGEGGRSGYSGKHH